MCNYPGFILKLMFQSFIWPKYDVISHDTKSHHLPHTLSCPKQNMPKLIIMNFIIQTIFIILRITRPTTSASSVCLCLWTFSKQFLMHSPGLLLELLQTKVVYVTVTFPPCTSSFLLSITFFILLNNMR